MGRYNEIWGQYLRVEVGLWHCSEEGVRARPGPSEAGEGFKSERND